MDKHAIFQRFWRLIKMSGRKKQILLRAWSNSFRYESDAEHQTGNNTQSKTEFDTASLLPRVL